MELLGWLGGFLFIYFRYLDAQQTTEEKEKSKTLYSNIWQKIDNANIQDLPKKVIKYLITIFDKRNTILRDIVASQKLKKLAHNWFLFVAILFIAQIGYENNKDNSGIFAWIEMVFTLLMGTQLGLFFLHRTKWSENFLKTPKANYLVFFAASYYLSFFITTAVLALENESIFGNRISVSVFFSNLIFDSFTILATFYILNYCIKHNKSLIYMVGIIIDITVAGIFAFLSLYLVTVVSGYKSKRIN